MNTQRLAAAVVLSLTLVPSIQLFAQEEEPVAGEPAWVECERGRLAISRQEYGEAVLHFKNALAQARVLPEAELGLGDVYFSQGDYALAESQYLRAYDQRESFVVPDMRYDVLYRLARLYFNQKKYGKMEETLKTIVKDDEVFSGSERERVRYRDAVMKLFTNKGFDAMFLLNRIPETFSTTALSELAHYYYVSWNFTPALQYALFGIIPLVTEGMVEIRKSNLDYRFTTLDDFLREAMSNEAVRAYLDDRSFFQRLYYLALICYETIPVRDSGRRFLRLLAATDAAGEYRRLAGLQLKAPFRENRIDQAFIELP
ncbi:MAG: tetratricopeptide repeat protein [Spirochaetales bacterium]|nr:tetratricopeptide repeat protein [Spirochaetales bacterium]